MRVGICWEERVFRYGKRAFSGQFSVHQLEGLVEIVFLLSVDWDRLDSKMCDAEM